MRIIKRFIGLNQGIVHGLERLSLPEKRLTVMILMGAISMASLQGERKR